MKSLQVLIVEDNPGDVLLISELLEETGIPLCISTAENGKKALDMIQKKNIYANISTPDLIILDLNLPIVKGFEVLSKIRSSQRMQSIPVVIMTGSMIKEDEVKARQMGATDYRVKPLSADEFESTCQWLRETLEPLVKYEKKRDQASGLRMRADALPQHTFNPLALNQISSPSSGLATLRYEHLVDGSQQITSLSCFEGISYYGRPPS
jgi:CheY-like chemotaxis protein